MERRVRLLIVLTCLGSVVFGGGWMRDGAAAAPLAVMVEGIRPGGVIPGVFTNCIPAANAHMSPGPNRYPAVSWAKGPAGTASYALIAYDTDVPASFANAYKEGPTLTASDKRRDIWYHWILIDIPSGVTRIPEGADPSGPAGPGKYGIRVIHQAGGGHAGYDGPCPPWNDMVVHHYHYAVYALDVPTLGLSGTFGGPEVTRATQGHVLAQGEVVGLSTLNPEVEKTLGVR
jgi:Raf kinase inhibitor-like YbhB/YbcL family protein